MNNADAIVWHNSDIKHPLLNDAPKRIHWQKWVLLDMEAPTQTYNDPSDLADNFNWTIGYRLKDDIFYPYGYTYPLKDHKGYVPAFPISVQKEGHLVSWMASHCQAVNGRENYVEFLKEFVPVHTFGKCGDRKCTKGQEVSCLAPYKFYLAFENSQCQDYVTEKFWRTLNTTFAIPIVMGGADYEKVAPPNSYLDVRNFTSPKHLAQFLIYLDAHSTEYAKYHDWRRNYAVEYQHLRAVTSTSREWLKPFCSLCAALHDSKKIMRQSSRNRPNRRDKECEYKKWNFQDVLPPNA